MEEKFLELSEKWKKETGGYSTSKLICNNDNYLAIIEMGEQVLPLIFRDINNGYWFEALKQITKIDPVPNEHYGDFAKMVDDWVNWAKENLWKNLEQK